MGNSGERQATLRTQFPEISPYHTDKLKVSDLHTISYEEYGNPNGQPVLFVHGGAGGTATEWDARFFDPKHYHIILFDQRGCGKSTPHADMTDVNAKAFVNDIEKLRTELNIDKWMMFGGSWGSTLALAYAETHPERVSGMILRGIWLQTDEEIKHLYEQNGQFRTFYPDHWAEYVAGIPEAEQGNLVKAFHDRVMNPDPAVHIPYAIQHNRWQGKLATLIPNPSYVAEFEDPKTALAMSRSESIMYMNNEFGPGRRFDLLADAHRVRDIPTIIIHGRHDMCCSVDIAHALHQALPKSDLEIVEGAGHSTSEPGIMDALIRATDKFKSLHQAPRWQAQANSGNRAQGRGPK